MKDSDFYPQLNECNRFLKQIGLVKEYNQHQSSPQNPGAFFRGLSYEASWKSVYSKYYYTFLFEDNSLMCFENKINGSDEFVCYTYLECPYQGDTYQEFLAGLELTYDAAGDEFRNEYEQYLSELGIKENVTPIRYEFRPDQHNPGLHPASHLHVGFRNDFRLGCGILFSPLMFVLFVVRQAYPSIWQKVLKGDIDPLVSRACRTLPRVETAYLHDYDKFEPYLFSH